MKGLRVFVAGQVIAWFVIGGLFVYVVQSFDKQRERDCHQALDVRVAATEERVAEWRDVQDILGNDPEDAAYFDDLVDRIRARSDALPTPAVCED